MNYRAIFRLVIFIQLTFGSLTLLGVQSWQMDSLDLQIQELIEKYDIPGAAIAIINIEGVSIDTYGYANVKENAKVTKETIFRIGSISKSFLAIAVVQLAEAGKIKLDDPVKIILPEIEMENKWEAESPVRIIHLLEHTSGIDDVHFNEGYNITDNQQLPLEEIFAKNPKSRNVQWQPGELCSYSNDAFSMLALIIEKVTGQPFEVYLKNNVFDIIGATSATYERSIENETLFARGYTNEGFPLEFIQVMMRPSGGLNMNITDLARFVQMLLSNGFYNNAPVIDSTTLNRMFFPSSSLLAREGFKAGYGAGFSTFIVNGHRFFGHGGGLPDFKSVFLIHPESGVGIVVLINKNSDYFWQLVKKVVSSLKIDNDIQDEPDAFTANKFEAGDIIGYYSQFDYGISLDRFPNYFLSGQKIYHQNDTLFIQEFQGDSQALILVNGNAYKRVDEVRETIYFYKNSEGKMMFSLKGKNFYVKDAAWKSQFHLVFLLFCIAIVISFVMYFLLWSTGRFIIKVRQRQIQPSPFLPRVFPLLAIISLVGCLYSLALWFGDYHNAGKITMLSFSVFIFSLLLPLFSVIGFWKICFGNHTKIKNRFENAYLIIVSSTLVGLSIFLYHYEIIGLRLWAY